MKGNWVLTGSFILVLGIMGGIALYSFHSIDSFSNRELRVSHTYKVLIAIDRLNASIKEGETAQRIYILAGDESSYRKALSRIDRQMDLLSRLTRDNPVEQRRIDAIRLVIRDNLGSLAAENHVRTRIRTVDRSRILAMVEQGKTVIGTIQNITQKMESAEKKLLKKRGAESLSEKKSADTTLALGNLMSVSMLTLGFLLLNRELRQRKKAQLSSKRHAEEFQDLYDHAPCGYHSLNEEGRIVRVNETELTWLGYSRGEFEGKIFFSDLLTQESREVFKKNFPVFLKSGLLENVGYDMVRKDGTILPVSLSATAIFDTKGRFLMSRSTIFDITERKKAQNQIVHLNDTLKEHADQLEIANKELESFSYSVSHDLRSPLRAIDGFSRILEEDYVAHLDNEGRRLLGVIRRNTEKMGNLIDDLLTFAKLGRKPLEKMSLNMEELVQTAFQEVSAGMEPNCVHLAIDPLPPAFGDRTLLLQAWINLLSNAIKFSSKTGNPRIVVRGIGKDQENIYSVSDNGVGFDMRFYNKLFGVFQRLHSQDDFPGTGVGLAIVHRVVSRHGGRIWAEGEIGKGATFSFVLPNRFSSIAGEKPSSSNAEQT